MTGDELFAKIDKLGGLCIDGLMKSSLPSDKGIYSIGEFKAMLVPSLVGKDKPSLEFWKKGERDQKFTRVNDLFLIIFEKEGNVILSNHAGLKINKSVGKYPNFPCYEFCWTGESVQGIPRGTLKFLRVDFSGSDFVSCHYDKHSGRYNVYNPRKSDLQGLGFPENLEEADEISGIPLERSIDFDNIMEQIIKDLEIEEFCKALLSCA